VVLRTRSEAGIALVPCVRWSCAGRPTCSQRCNEPAVPDAAAGRLIDGLRGAQGGAGVGR
jgi:hypothetical protein